MRLRFWISYDLKIIIPGVVRYRHTYHKMTIGIHTGQDRAVFFVFLLLLASNCVD